MAAKKKVKSQVAPLPKGFEVARQKLDGFFAREVGNSVIGTLKGSFQIRGKFGLKRIYRIEVTDGEVQIGEGEVVGPGSVIGLDETGYTRVLSDLEPGTTVFVRYEGKSGDGKLDPHVFTVAKSES